LHPGSQIDKDTNSRTLKHLLHTRHEFFALVPSSAFNNHQQPNLEEVRLIYSFSTGQPPRTNMRMITYRKSAWPPIEVTSKKKTKRRRSTRRRSPVSRGQLLSNRKRSTRRRNPASRRNPVSRQQLLTNKKTWDISLRALLQQKEETHFKD
jgi:hypothetical protein